MGDDEVRGYITDAPINDPLADRFDRAPFAQKIASTIAAQRDPASLVVGIYGPWGDGKTSVLNLVDRALAAFPHIVSVRFNPWQLGDESLVFQGFFATLADALDTKLAGAKERIGALLMRYGGLLKPIPFAGTAASEMVQAAGESLSATTLGALRDRIEALLRDSGKRVVILIDDLDRLDKAEVQLIFRLVKVAADFEHTAYVLALDDESVSAALAERYSSGSTQGVKFLEKIIQLPLHLPPVSEQMLRQVTLEAVDVALKQAGIEPSQAEINRFVSVFQRAITARLTTPRLGKRYGNAALFALPMIGHETNPVDLLLIEAMRIFFPSLYEWVRSHELEVLGGERKAIRADTISTGPVRAGFEEATKDLTPSESHGAQVLLTSLFPRTESAWENTGWPGEWDKTWTKQKKIASKHYFRRYFTYAVPSGDISDADIDALVGLLGAPVPDAKAVMELSERMVAQGGGATFLTKVAGALDGTRPAVAAHAVMLLASLSDAFSDQPEALGLTTMQRAAALISRLVAQVDSGDRLELVSALVHECDSLPLIIESFRWLASPAGIGVGEATLAPDEIQVLGTLLARRIGDLWLNDVPFTVLGRAVSSSLYIWSTYGDPGTVKTHLETRFRAEPNTVFTLMESFLGPGWSLETGVPVESGFRREAYDALAALVDPALIFSLLQETYGDDVGTGEFYAAEDQPRTQRLAHEFGYIHRAAHHEPESDRPSG